MENDLISRQAAIDAISCNITITGRQNAELVAATIGKFADRIKALPSAQPERNKGSWNVIQGDIVVCSECGMCAPKSMTGCLMNRHLESNRTNFCPNCGAYMRGEADGR